MTQAESSGQRRSLLLRLLVAGIVLALWFWTQSLLGARTAPASGIGDAFHNLTAASQTVMHCTLSLALSLCQADDGATFPATPWEVRPCSLFA